MKRYLTIYFVISFFAFLLSQSDYFKHSINHKDFFASISDIGRNRKVGSRNEKIDEIGDYIFRKMNQLKGNRSNSILSSYDKNIMNVKKDLFFKNQLFDFKKMLTSKSGIKSNKREVNYLITLQDSWKEIREDSLDLDDVKSKIKLIGGRGEWESYQIAITALEQSIDSVSLTLNDFPFSVEDIEFYWGEYVTCKRSVYKKKGSKVQDVLIPLNRTNKNSYTNRFFPTRINQNRTKSIFLNLFFPKKINPDDYSFSVTVKGFSNGKELEEYKVPVDVKVSEFKYNDRFKLGMLNSYTFNWTYWYYKDSSFVDSILPSHFEFLKKNHISPMHVFPDPEVANPKIEEWPQLFKDGANAFILCYIESGTYHKLKTESYKKEFIKKIKLKEKFLKEKKLLPHSYIFLFDEITIERSHQLLYVARILKENGIESKLFTTSSYVPPKKYIDAWCPLLQYYNENEHHFNDPIDTVFKEKWAYTCNTTLGDQYGNVFIDQTHLNPRRIFWNVYARNLSHFQYYSVNRWDKNLKNGKNNFSNINYLLDRKNGIVNWVTATYADQNGDGQLTYPGNNGEIWPSPRLFSYRDGIEDHQLFYQTNILSDVVKYSSKNNPLEVRDSILNSKK